MALEQPRTVQEAKRLIKDGQKAWKSAENFEDLLRLNVLFLRGELVAHPAMVIEPEDVIKGAIFNKETDRIRSILIRLNQHGLWTIQSQPGDYIATDKYIIEQRAFVDGYLPDALVRRLLSINSRDLGAITESFELENAPRIAVTTQGKPGDKTLTPFTWIGVSYDPEHFTGRIGEGAIDALFDCTPVAAYDKSWRRNTRLWPMLLHALNRPMRDTHYGDGPADNMNHD